MDYWNRAETARNAYILLWKAAAAIPISHYLLGAAFVCVVLLYNFLEFHFLEDVFTGFRGTPVTLTYHPSSHIYHAVVSKCRILHARYLATPWLSSPHIQTSFINFFGRPPKFSYRRQLFHASDGGTLALDWLLSSEVSKDATHQNSTISKDDTTAIVLVIPGLTSDSASPYLKHLAFYMAKCGWNVVVSNHRGLGGISVTSDCFYNAGWTEDVRHVIHYLHHEYPKAPLFVIGTSIGANVLVKYLGEDGDSTPIAGAAAVCSPWDLLIGSRFICRRLIQKLYDRALTIGLQGYAQMHQPRYSRLANWEGIIKSRSIRDFDTHATCLVGNYETVDTYYRHSSSAAFVGRVSVPLLCIGSLDDPVCTREAVPWDECRANKNVVLAMTKHGGHLAYFEGLGGSGLWWVRAVDEFLGVLLSSPFMHNKKIQSQSPSSPAAQSRIDQGPYISLEGGMVAAMSEEPTMDDTIQESPQVEQVHNQPDGQSSDVGGAVRAVKETELHCAADDSLVSKEANLKDAKSMDKSIVKRCLDQLTQQNRRTMWLLAYIAILSTWPLVGRAMNALFRKKTTKVLPPKTHK